MCDELAQTLAEDLARAFYAEFMRLQQEEQRKDSRQRRSRHRRVRARRTLEPEVEEEEDDVEDTASQERVVEVTQVRLSRSDPLASSSNRPRQVPTGSDQTAWTDDRM